MRNIIANVILLVGAATATYPYEYPPVAEPHIYATPYPLFKSYVIPELPSPIVPRSVPNLIPYATISRTSLNLAHPPPAPLSIAIPTPLPSVPVAGPLPIFRHALPVAAPSPKPAVVVADPSQANTPLPPLFYARPTTSPSTSARHSQPQPTVLKLAAATPVISPIIRYVAYQSRPDPSQEPVSSEPVNLTSTPRTPWESFLPYYTAPAYTD